MKVTPRIFALVLTLAVLIGTLMTVPVTAEENDGLSFTEYDMYAPVKTYDEAPNTFEAWIKLPKSTAGRAGVILGNYGVGNSVINFEVHQSGRPRLYWTESNGKNSDWIFTNVNVCTGDWVHVAIVRDVDAGKVHCYVNGTLKQSLSIAADKGQENTIPMGGLCIGGDVRGGNAQYFKGEIREIAVFSTVRSASNIEMDMLTPEGEDGLLAYYDLTGHVAGENIPDLSGNGCDTRYTYNVTWIEPKDKAPVTDYAYSFAVVGDTQVINEKHPDKFSLIYEWIVDQVEEKNIQFVFGLGDITERSTLAEWERAKEAIHSMDGIVPYSLVRGNHDHVGSFNQTFPLSDYEDEIIESFDRSMINTCRELTVGKIDYLIFTLDYGASDKVLAWVGDLCEEYPEHNVIITTHCYLFRDGTTLDQGDVCPPATTGGHNNGDHMWEKLVSQHENIVLVISGHDPCDRIIVAQDEGVHGNTVTQMLVDPQGADASLGGLGMVAILYFSEDGKDVTVEYYSTLKEKFYMGANQFTFTLDTVHEPAPIVTPPEETPTEEPQTPEEPEKEPEKEPEEQPKDEHSASVGTLRTGIWIAIIATLLVVTIAVTVIVTVTVMKKKR